ncbi:DEAD/DEAH box helicase [Flavimarina sp. Hel_I_48]|uniref:DEAD/DEAH box helicase n=1 Tax=Flavimarina sp. Hel_I_48 TaxID=1392488 RepID=UPI0004DEEB58|nr:DEAD/DEAH box helicase [Flavimarina sp. Hel_I_48]
MENFAALGINKDIIKGLNEMGIVKPTGIQREAIPILMQGETDLVGQAQTGTGKTAAYGLPVLERIDPTFDKPQALILSPTRELAQQVAKQLFKFTKYTEKIFCEAVYGGEKIDIQIKNLQRPTQVIVATPGRLIDLIKRKAVDLRYVKIVVLDEADEMLSLGFKKELDEILDTLKQVQNKWLFSATMPHGIAAIVNKHMSPEAHRIMVGKDSVVNKNIEHKFLICDDVNKLEILVDFLKSREEERGVIFCKTKAATAKLAKQLIARNISGEAIHGDMLQKDRDKVMRAFKNESLRLLIATDLAARGIDVEDLGFVVHYQFPDQQEYYTHRSGRTARAGKNGLSLALVNSFELKTLRSYEKALGISFSQIRQV